jgi:hypothetical protein
MSALGSTKSKSYRKLNHVESGGACRKIIHLTRGGLHAIRQAEVSRSRSSEEDGESQRSEGQKNYETDYIPDALRSRMVCAKERTPRFRSWGNSEWIIRKYSRTVAGDDQEMKKGTNASAE